MTRRRWIADHVSRDRALLSGEQGFHLARVLRARVGQEYEVATGDRVRLGRIVSVDERRGEVEFQLGSELEPTAGPSLGLLLAIFKFDRMEWAIEKATELGVRWIAPVQARRSDVRLVSAARKRVERWRRLALQAAQQSRRNLPPEIHPPQPLSRALTSLRAGIVLAEAERSTTLRAALQSFPLGQEIVLAIGPEGGWTGSELQDFQSAGWKAASLGQNILRAETATIAALAVASSEISAGELTSQSPASNQQEEP